MLQTFCFQKIINKSTFWVLEISIIGQFWTPTASLCSGGDSRKPILLVKIGETWRHSDVTHGLLIMTWVLIFWHKVWNCCSERYGKFQSEIPSTSGAICEKPQGGPLGPPPTAGRGLRLIWGHDHRSRSRSRSRRSRYILPGAGAGAGAAKQFYLEPEPEPEPDCFLGAGAGAGADQKCHGSASLELILDHCRGKLLCRCGRREGEGCSGPLQTYASVRVLSVPSQR